MSAGAQHHWSDCPTTWQKILNELHDTHPGVNKMKSLAQGGGGGGGYIWWPGMDADITELVQTCPVCQKSRPLYVQCIAIMKLSFTYPDPFPRSYAI